jgi:hypothetical protein
MLNSGDCGVEDQQHRLAASEEEMPSGFLRVKLEV